MVTFLSLAIAGVLLVHNKELEQENDEVKTMNIGIVSDEGNAEFLKFGLSLLENTDDIRYVCHFDYVSEKDGDYMLSQGKLDALAIFPKDYVKSVYQGVDKPITLRFGTGQSGMTTLLFRQLFDTISDYMIESKAGVYTMMDFYKNHQLNYYADSDQLAKRYMMRILARKSLIAEENANATGDVNHFTYYTCVTIILVLLFWGLSSGSILGKDHMLLSRLLVRQNMSKLKQYLARFLALFVFLLLNASVLCIIGSLVNITLKMAFAPVSFLMHLVPVLMLLCAIILCVYELSQDGIGGMLFFFFASVILGFLSGFFYPLSYFPVWMQSVAKWLPTRVMFEYISASMMENVTFLVFAKVIVYTIFFVGITLFFNTNESINFKIAGRRTCK